MRQRMHFGFPTHPANCCSDDHAPRRLAQSQNVGLAPHLSARRHDLLLERFHLDDHDGRFVHRVPHGLGMSDFASPPDQMTHPAQRQVGHGWCLRHPPHLVDRWTTNSGRAGLARHERHPEVAHCDHLSLKNRAEQRRRSPDVKQRRRRMIHFVEQAAVTDCGEERRRLRCSSTELECGDPQDRSAMVP